MWRTFSWLALFLATAVIGCVGATDIEQGEDLGTTEDEVRLRRCGGSAGRDCPSGYTCVDDPSDRCDRRRGGTDCLGVCRRTRPPRCDHRDPSRNYISHSAEECSRIRFTCVPGTTPFSDACGCGCQTVCNYDDPSKHYIGRSAEECSRILFTCVPGTTPFTDACGCGCQTTR